MISLSGLRCMAVGCVTHDRYHGRFLPGGCSFYAASVWHSLGCEASLVTSLGEDFQCHAFLDGLDVVASTCEQTTTFENRYDDHGNRVQHVSALGSSLDPSEVSGFSKKVQVLFLAPVLGELDPEPWLDLVDAGIAGLGLQGLLRQAGAREDEGSFRMVVPAPELPSPQMLQKLDAAFLSTEDLHGQPKNLMECLIENTPIVVLTRGIAGSTIWSGGEKIHIPASPADMLDPTGAGDTYAATFLAVLRAQGYERGVHTDAGWLATAGAWAAAAASIVVGGQGPLRMPEIKQIKKMIA